MNQQFIPVQLRNYACQFWNENLDIVGKRLFLGYSPERINPGDKTHTLTNIIKVVSGDSEDTLDRVSSLYKTIISAGTYEASSIKVAEAAKVIENTQRDLNIALINELAFIFHKIGIDTLEVLEAAETKWNFYHLGRSSRRSLYRG